jgi:hypothetical protein
MKEGKMKRSHQSETTFFMLNRNTRVGQTPDRNHDIQKMPKFNFAHPEKQWRCWFTDVLNLSLNGVVVK